MKILGYSGFNHDSAVALLDAGKPAFAIESEKVTRHKHEITPFPENAFRHLLRHAGLSPSDIDYLAVNYEPGFWANKGYLPHLYACLKQRNFDWAIIANSVVLAGSHNPIILKYSMGHDLPPILSVRHHLAHLASTFLYSPFEEAAVAIIDASGEIDATSTYLCRGRDIRKLGAMTLPTDSLGAVYMMCTRHLGYRLLGDEYKVMGLASCGESYGPFREFFESLIELLPDGAYRVNPRLAGRIALNGCQFPREVAERLGARREAGSDGFEPIHKSFAFELQRRLEEAILHVTRHLRTRTGVKNLCMAGGVALNSVANGKVLEDSGFDAVFIPPVPHDAGTSLGAATYLHYYRLSQERPAPLRHAYLGPSFDDAQIRRELDRCRQRYVTLADPAATAADLLSEGRVIAWFQGATEYGPRALGNRSILADPRPADMQHRVNALIKERESYRPFAPSVLQDFTAGYFPSLECSPYMLFVVEASEKARKEIPAVVHVNGTARPHTVTKETNPRFFALIDAFRERTGVPAVLNTSFNVAGEPIVNTPVDAIRCFNGSGLEAMIMGCYLLTKPGNGECATDGGGIAQARP
jgi:carbamoyltransferase